MLWWLYDPAGHTVSAYARNFVTQLSSVSLCLLQKIPSCASILHRLIFKKKY